MRFQITLLMIVVLTSACSRLGTPQTSTNQEPVSESQARVVLNIPHVIGKSPAEFEKVVGSPARVERITNDPDMMPGEYRDYKIANTLGSMTEDGLWVRFYKGVAHHITLDLPKLVDTPEEALLMAGIDVRGKTARVRAPIADRWSGNFNGVDFKDVAAFKMDASMKKYSTVQAELAQ